MLPSSHLSQHALDRCRSLVAGVVLGFPLLAPTVAMAGPAPRVAPTACPFALAPFDLDQADGLAVFAVQGLSAADVWVEGPVAAGQSLVMRGFDLGGGTGGGLVADSAYGLDLREGVAHGDVSAGFVSNIASNVSFTDGGVARTGTLVDPGTALTHFLTQSSRLSALADNGTAYTTPWSELRLEGTDPNLVVVSVTPAELNAAGGVVISAPSTATVVLNVGPGAVVLDETWIRLDGPAVDKVLWHQPAGGWRVERSNWLGTFFGPGATVVLEDGSWEGQIVGRTVTLQGALSWAPFMGTIDRCTTGSTRVSSCTATPRILGSWPTSSGFGYIAELDITWHGAPQSAWAVQWNFPGSETVTHLWSGTARQAGSAVRVENASWNAAIADGGSLELGWLGASPTAPGLPVAIHLNGIACHP